MSFFFFFLCYKRMSYPDINDKNFYRDITKKFKKYKIDHNPSFREVCYPRGYTLQEQQKLLGNYLNPDTPYKGVLIFHKIGSGKTCTAIQIGEAWKHERKIMIVLPASLKDSFRNELRSLCAGNEYLSKKERNTLKTLQPYAESYKSIIKESNKRIDKYYTIYSYNKFVMLAEQNEISLKNTLLLVDEIQNMVSEEGKYYEILYKTIHLAPKNLRIVLMSATPMFDKPIEIALTMNLLRLPTEFPTGIEFEKMFIKLKQEYINGLFKREKIVEIFEGWITYVSHADTYKYRRHITRLFNSYFPFDKNNEIENIKKHENFVKKLEESYHQFTSQKTLQLLKKGLSVKQITEQRNVKENTVWDHISKLIEYGQLNVWKVLPKAKILKILAKIYSHNDTLKEIKIRLNDNS